MIIKSSKPIFVMEGRVIYTQNSKMSCYDVEEGKWLVTNIHAKLNKKVRDNYKSLTSSNLYNTFLHFLEPSRRIYSLFEVIIT